jgi:hypothetical protein
MDEKKVPDNKKMEWSKPELVELSKAMNITKGGIPCTGGYGNPSGCAAGTGYSPI